MSAPPNPIIVISPIRSFVPPTPPGWEYYPIAQEFPHEPLKTLMLWVNYPWMFAPNNGSI